MSLEFKQFKEFQKFLIEQEKKRLGLLKTNEDEYVGNKDEEKTSKADEIGVTQREGQHVEAVPPLDLQFSNSYDTEQTVSLVERLDLSCNDGSLEKEKQSFIDRLVNSENPLTVRSDDSNKCAMSRWGEFSPNRLRVATAPYLGLGEYDQRKQLLLKQRQADYKEHINQKNEQIKTTAKKLLSESRLVSTGHCKAVQTDIQNIHNKLICTSSVIDNQVSKESSPESTNSNKENQYSNTNVQRIDQRLTSDQNSQLRSEMDKPRSILSNRRTGTPTDQLMSDYNHGYGSSCMDGFSYHDRIDEVQRERLKREAYQQELRKQIDDKRRLSELRLEQERMEQDRENRRLEQQLVRMHEEQLREDQIRAIRDEQARRTSDDYMRRQQDVQYRSGYRKRLESESSPLSHRNTNVASKLSHYSPPVTRRSHFSHTLPASSSSSYPGTSPRYGTLPSSRYDSSSLTRKDTLNRMDLLNSHGDAFLTSSSSSSYGQRDHQYHNNPSNSSRFSRFDSLSRIDLLKQQDMLNRLETLSINDNSFGMCNNGRVERRHSATQQDLSMLSSSRRSPKMQRRSSSSRLDEPLPAPILKAHSPVARELKNSIAVNSGRMAASASSDLFRRYEDKWQVPSKSLSHHGDGLMMDGQNRSILTQLGTIRMQLQKEQLRMDETLRQRGSQSKAVNFH